MFLLRQELKPQYLWNFCWALLSEQCLFFFFSIILFTWTLCWSEASCAISCFSLSRFYYPLFRKSCLTPRYLLSRIICPLLPEGSRNYGGVETMVGWFFLLKDSDFTRGHDSRNQTLFKFVLSSINLICFSILSFSHRIYSPFLLVHFLSWGIAGFDFLLLLLMRNNSHHPLSARAEGSCPPELVAVLWGLDRSRATFERQLPCISCTVGWFVCLSWN